MMEWMWIKQLFDTIFGANATIIILILLYSGKKSVVWFYRYRKGILKQENDEKRQTRDSVQKIETKVNSIDTSLKFLNGSVQEHHSDKTIHVPRTEIELMIEKSGT